MGEGVWRAAFVWMAGIRGGSHKFSRGLFGTGAVFHCKCDVAQIHERPSELESPTVSLFTS